MAKRPADAPKVGDRVALRGRGKTGVLKSCDEKDWCRVEWDEDGPRLCHLNELQAAN